jgi:hypothetical protein
MKDGSCLLEGGMPIKLGGIRINLRDLELTIIRQSNSDVRDALLSLRTTGSADTAFLVAHVVVSSTTIAKYPGLLKNLRISVPLPQYLLPSIIVALGTFPTATLQRLIVMLFQTYLCCKEKHALSATPLPSVRTKQRTKQSTEGRLQNIWSQAFGVEVVS